MPDDSKPHHARKSELAALKAPELADPTLLPKYCDKVREILGELSVDGAREYDYVINHAGGRGAGARRAVYEMLKSKELMLARFPQSHGRKDRIELRLDPKFKGRKSAKKKRSTTDGDATAKLVVNSGKKRPTRRENDEPTPDDSARIRTIIASDREMPRKIIAIEAHMRRAVMGKVLKELKRLQEWKG